MASPETIEQIKEQTDLVALVSRYVRLQNRGGTWWGCCPFHHEKTPSFTVSPARRSYYCFGCQKGGDAINFLMELEHLSFFAALQQLASPLGISVEEGDNGQYEEQQKHIAALRDLYDKVARVYQHLLWHSADGERVMAYIRHRGLNEETINKFVLGYAPANVYWLHEFLSKKGYSEQFLAESGLFSKKNNRYALFADRLTFPITNLDGKVIAFTCRDVRSVGQPKRQEAASDRPKYINSPDTAIYKKKSSLYGLYQAKEGIKNEQAFMLCEGSFDVCALHQSGLPYAVAPLGTGFTTEQAKLLKRLSNKAVIFFDADDAGRKAALKAAIICEQNEIESSIITLTNYKDAGEIIEKKEEKLLIKAVKNARFSFDFLLNEAVASIVDQGPKGSQQVVEAMLPYVESVLSPVRREGYLKALAFRLDISVAAMTEEYARLKATKNSFKPEEEQGLEQDPVLVNRPLAILEQPLYDVFIAFLAVPSLYQCYRSKLKEEYLQGLNEQIAVLLNYIDTTEAKGGIFSLIEGNLIDRSLKDYFLKKITTDDIVGWDEKIERALLKLEKQYLEGCREQLTEAIKKAKDDEEQLKELINKRMLLAKQLGELKGKF